MSKETLVFHDKWGSGVKCPPCITDDYTHDFMYCLGDIAPRFPVPAIIYEAVFGVLYEECMWDTVLILRHIYADDDDPYLEAICDMNWDRCMDFETPHGESYSARGRAV